MAHPGLKAIRERYGFRCGYCGVSETDQALTENRGFQERLELYVSSMEERLERLT